MRAEFTHVSRREPIGERTDVRHWAQVVQAEYLDMPGLQLTKPQMQRLWGIDQATCDLVVTTLEGARFLWLTARNSYMRADQCF